MRVKTLSFLLTISASVWAALGITVFPKPALGGCLFLGWFINLLVGLVICEREHRKAGPMLHKSFRDLAKYVLAVGAAWLLAILLSQLYPKLPYASFLNALIASLGLIELMLAFVGLSRLDPDSLITRKIFSPILRLIIGRLDQLTSKLPDEEAEKIIKDYENDNKRADN